MIYYTYSVQEGAFLPGNTFIQIICMKKTATKRFALSLYNGFFAGTPAFLGYWGGVEEIFLNLTIVRSPISKGNLK